MIRATYRLQQAVAFGKPDVDVLTVVINELGS